MKVLAIGGFGRSGSTVLEMVLGASPNVFALGELKYIWRRGVLDGELCACGSPLTKCHFWGEVLTTAFGDSLERVAREMATLAAERLRQRHMPQLVLMREAATVERRRYREILQGLLEAVLRVLGDDEAVLLDSSKDIAHLSLYPRSYKANGTFLHLVRDPRGVVYSWGKRRRRPEVEHSEAFMPVYSERTCVRDWAWNNAWARVEGGGWRSYRRINYENFADAPSAVVDPVLESLGVKALGSSWSERTLALPDDYHSVAGNPVRFGDGAITIRPDNEWRQEMSLFKRARVKLMSVPVWWAMKETVMMRERG